MLTDVSNGLAYNVEDCSRESADHRGLALLAGYCRRFRHCLIRV